MKCIQKNSPTFNFLRSLFGGLKTGWASPKGLIGVSITSITPRHFRCLMDLASWTRGVFFKDTIKDFRTRSIPHVWSSFSCRNVGSCPAWSPMMPCKNQCFVHKKKVHRWKFRSFPYQIPRSERMNQPSHIPFTSKAFSNGSSIMFNVAMAHVMLASA